MPQIVQKQLLLVQKKYRKQVFFFFFFFFFFIFDFDFGLKKI
jgi:hypothetical protein